MLLIADFYNIRSVSVCFLRNYIEEKQQFKLIQYVYSELSYVIAPKTVDKSIGFDCEVAQIGIISS